MKKYSHRLWIVVAALLAASAAQSQVVLNEFCTANYSDYNVDSGWGTEYEDWVELYNPLATAVNISGYWLSDDISNPQKWSFPVGTSVAANSYLVVLLSGTGDYDPSYMGALNTSFTVTQTNGEDIVFANAGGTILESYDIGAIGAFQANHSYARTVDGGSDWTIHTDPSPNASNSGATAVDYVQKPVISVQAGYQAAPINVTITAPAGTTIYYTLDGSEPNNTDAVYAGPVNINATKVLRAIAYSADPNILPSLVETNTYFFGSDSHQTMVVSISGTTLSDGTWGWGGGELTHIEFFTPEGVFIAEAYGDSNEHGNDSNAYPQKGFDYITRDALGSDNAVQYPLFSTSDRPSYERLIFKAAANDNYPSSDGAHIRDAYVHTLSELGGLHLDERKAEMCVVYINGAYWGVYDAREKADDTDYTEYYYGQPKGFVDYLKTWGGTWEEYGSGTDWYDLVDFITTNDMTDDANYQYVLTQYNTMSLIDYFILNGYVVCTDWLNWNTAWWRGRNPDGDAKRWRYTLWDNDATFDHYVNYTGVPSTNPDADPCQIEGMNDVGGQGHVPVLNALFDNENFLADYVQRYASLSNTIFSCDRMVEVLDSMIAVIDPEMERQCTRWGGTYAEWQGNVNDMRNFILARCADEIIGGIEDCYDVTAYTVTVNIDGTGEIIFSDDINLDNSTAPWSGTYFGDLDINLSAPSEDTGCGSFAGWEITSGTGTIADPTNPNTTMQVTSDVTVVAHFSAPSTGPVVITTDISIAGAGAIEVNGTPQLSYPQQTTQDGGAEMSLDASVNEWFTFDHWESLHATLSPDETSTSITLTPCLSDTITAVYIAIDHFELNVDVDDVGGGTILMDGNPIPEGGTTIVVEGGETISFTAVADDEWSVFAGWQIDGNSISPDNLSANVILTLIENGTITAVFTIIPHSTVTVIVEPMYAGTVVFGEEHLTGNSYSTNSIMTVELEGNMAQDFNGTPEPYWNFINWTSRYAAPTPDDKQPQVYFNFLTGDTVVAHFEKEPFEVYIPNSFSPNNDGTNDVWHMVGNAIDPASYHMMIFNRWGDTIFESTDMNKVWEGDVKGGEFFVSDNTYQYLLKVKSVHDAEPREYSGSIMVFR